MTTVLQARPRQFVVTPATEQLADRALRYLQTGYSIHLKGPAGTGKTTLAMHLAHRLDRPMIMLFGDDEFKTSDLIGNQTGYTRKKVVDNYIHSVIKVEDELRQNWVDSRLTLACREGFTLIYDEFNRSRPEVNNVLLSALEEKFLVLPPNGRRQEYVQVNPQFRVIFTSNPAEYCGVHATQDALLDRLITIHLPAPDELTQQQILVQKIGIEPAAALKIVQIARQFLKQLSSDNYSSLRPCLMIANICYQHDIEVSPSNPDFRDVCRDILLSRANQSMAEANEILWTLFNQFDDATQWPVTELSASELAASTVLEPSLDLFLTDSMPINPDLTDSGSMDLASVDLASVDLMAPDLMFANPNLTEANLTEANLTDSKLSDPMLANPMLADPMLADPMLADPMLTDLGSGNLVPTDPAVVNLAPADLAPADLAPADLAPADLAPSDPASASFEQSVPSFDLQADTAAAIYQYLKTVPAAKLSEIEQAVGRKRVFVVNGLIDLIKQQLVAKQDVPGKPSVYQVNSIHETLDL